MRVTPAAPAAPAALGGPEEALGIEVEVQGGAAEAVPQFKGSRFRQRSALGAFTAIAFQQDMLGRVLVESVGQWLGGGVSRGHGRYRRFQSRSRSRCKALQGLLTFGSPFKGTSKGIGSARL